MYDRRLEIYTMKRSQFRIYFKAKVDSRSTIQGLWKMHISASESPYTSKGTPGTDQILTETDSQYSGTTLNFLSKITEVDGFDGCVDDKKYLCLWLYKGSYLAVNGVCFEPTWMMC